MKKTLPAVFVAACVFAAFSLSPTLAKAEGKTRTYYIAVDEIDWDYTPMGHGQNDGYAP
jgi:hypothetical protein